MNEAQWMNKRDIERDIHTHVTNVFIYIYIYMYIYLCIFRGPLTGAKSRASAMCELLSTEVTATAKGNDAPTMPSIAPWRTLEAWFSILELVHDELATVLEAMPTSSGKTSHHV